MMESLLLAYSQRISDEEQQQQKNYHKSILIQCEPTV